jgi:hypothetical protein
MLIEQLELNGISVKSANTDGLEYYCPRDKVTFAETLIFDLELVSGYEMEHGEYDGLYAKDVNNYVAKYGDKVKAKGLYAETTLMKGRSTPIVYTAIREYLRTGKEIEDTIYECRDINEFVAGRTVKGGACYKEEPLGKAVRWYYSKQGDSLYYCSNGNLVPKTGREKVKVITKHNTVYFYDNYEEACSELGVPASLALRCLKGEQEFDKDGSRWEYSGLDGVKPIMDLPDTFDEIADDIDYDWYISEAISKLNDLGVEYA